MTDREDRQADGLEWLRAGRSKSAFYSTSLADAAKDRSTPASTFQIAR
jgi:hypothetical protein